MANNTEQVYQSQGFGRALELPPPYGLLLVDFVNGFADPARFGGGNIPAAIERSKLLLSEARKRGWAIAHSRIVFADDGSDANIFSEKIPTMLGLTENDPASAIVDALAPMRGELVVRKTVPSAFFATGLSSWLTARAVRTLLVGGCVTSGCVRASVVDAMNHGFRPVVVEDCVGDRALEPHHSNLFDMRQKNAQVLSLDQFLATIM